MPDFRALIEHQKQAESGDAFVTQLTDRLLQGDKSALSELSTFIAELVSDDELTKLIKSHGLL